MPAGPANWIVVSESQFPWEREALAFIRAGWPTHEPYRAWTNFEFMADDAGFDRTLDILRQRYSFPTLIDSDIAKASLAEYVEIWTGEGRDNVLRTVADSWRRGYDELVRAGLAEGGHDPSAWFTNELVPAR